MWSFKIRSVSNAALSFILLSPLHSQKKIGDRATCLYADSWPHLSPGLGTVRLMQSQGKRYKRCTEEMLVER